MAEEQNDALSVLQAQLEYHRRQVAAYENAIQALTQANTVRTPPASTLGKYHGWRLLKDAMVDYLSTHGEVTFQQMIAEMLAEGASFGRNPKLYLKVARIAAVSKGNAKIFLVAGEGPGAKITLRKRKVS